MPRAVVKKAQLDGGGGGGGVKDIYISPQIFTESGSHPASTCTARCPFKNFYYCCISMARILETIHHIIRTNMLCFAMQAHYSAASRLAYITQSNKKTQVHVGLATQCLTNAYGSCRYKRTTAVIVTQNISMIVIATFLTLKKKKKKKTIRASQIAKRDQT